MPKPDPRPASSSVERDDRPSRRDALVRLGSAAGVLAGAALLGRAAWDKGGFGLAAEVGARQVRDYRVANGPRAGNPLAELVIARGGLLDAPGLASDLVGKALDALGGMKPSSAAATSSS